MNPKKITRKTDPLAKKIAELEAQLETLQTEAEEAKAASLRALADLENFRRRQTSQQALWSSQAVASFLRPVLSSFLELSLGADHSEDEALKQVVAKFFETLHKQGLSQIKPVAGETIDPDKHEVLLAEDGEAGTVVRCLEIGWQLEDQVIQPAKISGATA